MRMLPARVRVLLGTLLGILAGCAPSGPGTETIRAFPTDDLEGVLDAERVAVDRETTRDGSGALRIEARDTTTVRLFAIEEPYTKGGLLVYRADLRSADLEGCAYLEMTVRIPGRGEYFVRSHASPISGTTDWSSRHTGYLFREGDRADRIGLNLVVAGRGIVWIDAVALERRPRP